MDKGEGIVEKWKRKTDEDYKLIFRRAGTEKRFDRA